jgi:thiamine-phosphate pyrophosphorylase
MGRLEAVRAAKDYLTGALAAADVIAAGAAGIAVVSAICAADDPAEAAAGLRRAIAEGSRP